jgi:hypothetical protein
MNALRQNSSKYIDDIIAHFRVDGTETTPETDTSPMGSKEKGRHISSND